jgi:hypothetical protein
MTENVEDDVTMLHEEIHRLRDEIRCQAVHNASRTTLKHRRELQLELEVTLQRLAERVETKRVEEVQRHATESGFFVNPSRIDDECPLCLETIPEWRNDAFVKLEQTSQKFLCCGKVCCEPCIIKFNKAYTPDRVRCPFCRLLNQVTTLEKTK